MSCSMEIAGKQTQSQVIERRNVKKVSNKVGARVHDAETCTMNAVWQSQSIRSEAAQP